MSVGVDRLSLPITNSGSLSFIITEKQPVRHFTSQATREKKRQEKAIFQKVSRRMFNSGVRAPLLTDVPSNSNFRIDLVDSRQFSKSQRLLPSRGKESTRSCMSSLQSLPSTKGIKFLLPDGSFKPENNSDHAGKLKAKRDEAWERWKEQMVKTRDARDILYRNTYYPVEQNIRYHTCSLPRIESQRPWTVGDTSHEKSRKVMVLENQENEQSTDRNIVPQPEPKKLDLIHIKGLQKQNTLESTTSEDYFEVRKIKSHVDFPKGNVTHFSTVVRQPSDLSHRYDLIRQRRSERPLKRENIHYKPVNVRQKGPPHLEQNFGMTERDQKSVAAYKEYVESMRQRGIEGRNAEIVSEKGSSASHYGFENRMLQSVIDVNQPQDVQEKKQDQQSANHNDKNSIVIQIKSSWDDNVLDKHMDDGLSQGCPTNSPVPEHRNDEIDMRTRIQDS